MLVGCVSQRVVRLALPFCNKTGIGRLRNAMLRSFKCLLILINRLTSPTSSQELPNSLRNLRTGSGNWNLQAIPVLSFAVFSCNFHCGPVGFVTKERVTRLMTLMEECMKIALRITLLAMALSLTNGLCQIAMHAPGPGLPPPQSPGPAAHVI